MTEEKDARQRLEEAMDAFYDSFADWPGYVAAGDGRMVRIDDFRSTEDLDAGHRNKTIATYGTEPGEPAILVDLVWVGPSARLATLQKPKWVGEWLDFPATFMGFRVHYRPSVRYDPRRSILYH